MVSLAAVWEAAGVTPDAVVGHSQGEIAAAMVAGVLSLEDGARVVALRSRALRALAGRGAMASVAEPAAAVRDRITAGRRDGRCRSRRSTARPPRWCRVTRPRCASWSARCQADGVRARVLPVDYASHCAQVDRIRDEVLAALDGISPGAGAVPMISAMTGQWLDGPEAGAGYWYASLRAPVRVRAAGRGAGARPGTARSSRSPRTRCSPLPSPRRWRAPATVRHRHAAPRRRRPGPAAGIPGRAHMSTACRWTGPRCCPAASGSTCPPTRSSRQRYWPRPARAQAGVGSGGRGPVLGGGRTTATCRSWPVR